MKGGVESISLRRKAFKIFIAKFGVVILTIMIGKVSWNIFFCLYSTCLTKSKMHQWQHLFCHFYLKISFKINCRFHQISENSRSRSPSSESPPISDAQDIPVVRGRGNGRRGRETDLSEDQEADLSADLEVVIGKEELVVGDEEVAGQGK